MILLDVNVMAYAFKAAEPDHERYRSWLEAVLADGTERIGLAESAVTGFVRVVTNPRVYSVPAPTATAVAFVDALTSEGRAGWLAPTDATWQRFRELCEHDRQVRGNLVPDAWLAALAISHGARLATADRGFARFDGLTSFDPGAN